MTEPVSTLAQIQALAARCVDACDPQLSEQFHEQFGTTAEDFVALAEPAQHAWQAARQQEQLLSRAAVQTILRAQDESCDRSCIGYYPTLQALAEKVRGSKSWAMGEVFVHARTPEDFVVMKQLAPNSCEMLTVTNKGYLDVLTAYRFEQDELVDILQEAMGEPPTLNAKQAQAIQDFAAKNGRSWKLKLSQLWSSGKDDSHPDGALLRQVRNNFGPQWLQGYELPKTLVQQLNGKAQDVTALAHAFATITATDDYGKGYKEAMQAMCMVLSQKVPTGVLDEAVEKLLDTYATKAHERAINNDDTPHPGM